MLEVNWVAWARDPVEAYRPTGPQRAIRAVLECGLERVKGRALPTRVAFWVLGLSGKPVHRPLISGEVSRGFLIEGPLTMMAHAYLTF